MEELELGGAGGRLCLEEQGNRIFVQAVREDDGEGLYKAYLTGKMGGELLLGTLAPEKGRLCVQRLLSKSELERRGLWPVTGGRVEMAFPFSRPAAPPPSGPWQREETPGRLLGEELLRRCAGKLRDTLLKREDGGFALAAPYDPGAPFPLCPLFCFARVEELSGRRYAVFHFNSCGCPIFPEDA